jgi:hypothetical protein
MFGEFEIEPYPSGLYFPPADEEAWLAFQASLTRLRPAPTAARVGSIRSVLIPSSSVGSILLRLNEAPSRIATPAYP